MSDTASGAPEGKERPRLAPAEAAGRLGIDYDEFQAAERLLAFGLSRGEAISNRLIADFALVRARIERVAAGGCVADANDPKTLEADFEELTEVLQGAIDGGAGRRSPSSAGSASSGSASSGSASAGSASSGSTSSGSSSAGSGAAGSGSAGADPTKGVEFMSDAPPATAALFQRSYADLSRIMTPVTAETLRDSLPETEGGSGDGYRWSKTLWAITTVFLLAVLASQMYRAMTGMDAPAGVGGVWSFWDALVIHVSPFVYGGLGACVHLLRTCHKYLAARTFSRLRKNEYLSRILLGVVAGGAVLLVAENIYDDGAPVNLLSAALAFLAGFNVDFLYQALDRVSNAVLPKVGLDSVRERPAVKGGAVDPQALLAFIDNAKTPEAKAAAQKLLDAIAPPGKPKGS